MKNYLFKKEFWIAAAHRSLRTIAQAFISTVGAATVIESINWRYVISASILAGIVSIATSAALGIPEIED